MNRTIKFRAWNEEENRMWEWRDLKYNLNNRGNAYATLDDLLGDNFELMQYTELKDGNGKDGVEIYEGDIVEYLCGGRTVKEVYFEDGVFGVRGDESTFGVIQRITYFGNPTVIGNIYENPELLKGEK